MELKDTVTELGSNTEVVILAEFSRFVVAKIIAEEGGFQCERMRDWELFPCDDPACAHFIRLYLEPAIFKAK